MKRHLAALAAVLLLTAGDPKTLAASPQLRDAYLGMASETPV
jgi:hypothetical protein